MAGLKEGEMPRHPDPELEERILKAADVLWRRGGQKALTMRAVAKAAGTNTPAVYRRFKNREDLLKGLVLRIANRVRTNFEVARTLEGITEAYVAWGLQHPNDYELFFSHVTVLDAKKGRKGPRPIRESRPNFGFVEQIAAKELGGNPDDHTRFALQAWALLHGAVMLILSKAIPDGHEEELLKACRAGMRILIAETQQSVASVTA
jgi:AcrR family transcriptional regulator